MAAILRSYCCNSSYNPIENPTKQSKATKQAQFSQQWSKPNSLAVTRSLSALVDSGSMDTALHLFEKMNHSDTFIWNVMIRGFTSNGMFSEALEFHRRMELDGVPIDHFTFPFVIKACGELSDLSEGERIHGKAIKVGLDFDVYVGNFLVEMYMKFGLIECAEKVFDEMPVRDLVSWNSVVGGCLMVGDGLRSLGWFREMVGSGVGPDRVGLISALRGCSVIGCLRSGKEVHCQVIRLGIHLDVMIGTSLVDMYGKCGEVGYAERVFSLIPLKNAVVWNALINAYVASEKYLESFACLKVMQEDHTLVVDAVSLINVLPSCSQLGGLKEVKSIHGYAIRKLLLPHVVLETALVDAYGKCGAVRLAEGIFGRMNEKNLVSWNTMVAAYVQNEMNEEALDLFQDLWLEKVKPDAITIASVLPAYAELASLSELKQIHGYAAKFGPNAIVYNALIHAYAKSGDLETARRIFDEMSGKNLVSWNTMILDYAIHGFGETAISLFSAMKGSGIEPDHGTFVSLLYACSISGLVNKGWEYFNAMKPEYNIDPGVEHYGCMVDLLGRSGDLNAVKEFIKGMPLTPTARIWGSLLAASRNNNDLESAELAAKEILSLEHDNTGCYVLLSNMYAEAGRWEDVNRIKALMNEKGIKKTTGCCRVETEGKSQRFINNDKSHPQLNMIKEVLDLMLKKTGYQNIHVNSHSNSKFIPETLIKKRANSPKHHSVKLAICFGLISTAVGKPVIIRKNTRICEDCHRVAKKISLASSREIMVRDPKVFHHFNGGVCSCGDYW
ncbi:Pentatricopeptide repeat-containing protein At4g35130, chloroplastic [Linum perenne]